MHSNQPEGKAKTVQSAVSRSCSGGGPPLNCKPPNLQTEVLRLTVPAVAATATATVKGRSNHSTAVKAGARTYARASMKACISPAIVSAVIISTRVTPMVVPTVIAGIMIAPIAATIAERERPSRVISIIPVIRIIAIIGI